MGLFLISSLFLIFAKCYCQVHFPFLLFRLCFSQSALASLHLPASPRLCTCLQFLLILPTAPRPHSTPTPSFGSVVSSGICNSQIQALITSGQHPMLSSSSPIDLPTHAHQHGSYSCCKESQQILFREDPANSNNCMLCAAFPQSVQKSVACTLLFPAPITSRALYCFFLEEHDFITVR